MTCLRGWRSSEIKPRVLAWQAPVRWILAFAGMKGRDQRAGFHGSWVHDGADMTVR